MSPLNPARDLRLSGQVIYTGLSSMEVAVKMESIGMGKSDETVLLGKCDWLSLSTRIDVHIPFCIGRFSMVCRDARTHRAREVNSLILSTDEERELYALGERMSV